MKRIKVFKLINNKEFHENLDLLIKLKYELLVKTKNENLLLEYMKAYIEYVTLVDAKKHIDNKYNQWTGRDTFIICESTDKFLQIQTNYNSLVGSNYIARG
jgi:hypothetical protein